MNGERAERKLAAILSADVVGYSARIGRDELGTRAEVRGLSENTLEPQIARHGGRLFKSLGDGFLVEFPSVVDAVDCAVAIQTQLSQQGGGDDPLRLRIGINLGDVLIEGADLHGDGVNVAARIESLAEPGGILISRTAWDQIRDKLDVEIEDRGEVSVKNIVRPVRVFEVRWGEDAVNSRPKPPRRKLPIRLVAATAAVLAMVAALLWWAPWQTRLPAAQVSQMQLELPETPSVAVLPFSVLSSGEDDQLVAEALAEDLTRSLARVSNLFVIARSSTLQYVGAKANPAEVAESLGVRHIVRASFRRSGEQVRLDAELIDAISGRIVWSDRFERNASDIFALQDELVDRLARQLSADLSRTRDQKRFTSNPEAFFAWSRGEDEAWGNTKASFENARALARSALALDPGFVRAKALLAFVETQTGYFRMASDPQTALERGLALARQAVAEEPDDWYTHATLGQALMNLRDYPAADAEYSRAIEMEPSHTYLLTRSTLPLIFMGRGAEAEARLRVAIRLNPFHNWLPDQLMGQALYLQGRFAEAAGFLEAARQRNPRFRGNMWWRAATYGQLGDEARAAAALEDVMAAMPGARVSGSFIQFTDPAATALFEEGLRKAGMPD